MQSLLDLVDDVLDIVSAVLLELLDDIVKVSSLELGKEAPETAAGSKSHASRPDHTGQVHKATRSLLGKLGSTLLGDLSALLANLLGKFSSLLGVVLEAFCSLVNLLGDITDRLEIDVAAGSNGNKGREDDGVGNVARAARGRRVEADLLELVRLLGNARARLHSHGPDGRALGSSQPSRSMDEPEQAVMAATKATTATYATTQARRPWY